jgi:hypothetical protein
MDILRYGSQRYRGTKSVLSDLSLEPETEDSFADNVSWDKAAKQIVIRASWVPHGDGRTNHEHLIRLDLEDVSALIAILGHAGSATDASLLREHLREQLPALVKLLACATGLVPTPMAETKALAGKLV